VRLPYRAGEPRHFGATHLIDVLRGNANEKIRQWGHDKVSTFGIGKDRSVSEWHAIFRQLIAHGLLVIDHGGHGALLLGDSARAVLKGEELITCAARSASRASPATVARAGRGSTTRRRWMPTCWPTGKRCAAGGPPRRKSMACPYVIFHDATLAELARSAPESLDELAEVPGIGASKLERYGEEILEILRA
jgi:ATP-dependent DNA helicase RecQ